jgi:hypothetical protein
MNGRMAGVVAAMAISGGATAQDAVQWRVEDGGNGHWYQIAIRPKTSWSLCLEEARSLGGDLASITTSVEQSFVRALAELVPAAYVDVWGPFIGGYQDANSSDYSEPSGGWRWTDGSAWNYQAWSPTGEPNNCLGGCSGCIAENRTQLLGGTYGGRWNDISDVPVACGDKWITTAFVLEWSADCNSDGIVDFGQIRDGTLADANLNNIPDCCEGGPNCGPCIADVVQDGTVNGVDLAAVINAWGTDGGKLPRADIDGSGLVDGADLAQVLGSWGPCN